MKYLSPLIGRETNIDPTNYKRNSWRLVRCQETGFVFLPNPPEYSYLEDEIAWEKTFTIEKERRQREEPIFSLFSSTLKYAKLKIFPKRNKMASIVTSEVVESSYSGLLKVLDIGCGEGRLLLEIYRRLTELGCNVNPIGIEVSKVIAEIAQANLNDIGGKVFQNNALDALEELEEHEEDLVNIVVMHSFLEHECHPLRLLRILNKLLPPNGVIFIKVPNFDCWNRFLRGNRWCGFRYPDHVNYFTPKTLRILAEEVGFAVSRQKIFDRFPTSDNMYAVLKKIA